MAKKKSASRDKLPDKVSAENIDLDNPEFQRVLELVNHTRQSIFLTGRAGTGKSTFLRHITAHTRKKFVVLAPTGIAAVNVGGVTMHSFFRIPFKPLLPDDPDFSMRNIRDRLKYPSSHIKLLREVDLIIIDEISMVRADIIDFIDKVLRYYSGNRHLPFGGKQLLLIGDVFQLEPVVTADMRDILRPVYGQPFFFNALAFRGFPLVTVELRKVYRQESGTFIEILDRVRTGHASADDILTLNSRVCAPGSESPTDGVMTLTSRRDMAEHINRAHLDAIDRPIVTFKGTIKGDFPDNSLPTDLELSLKEGAQVVFIKNSPDKTWVNGTIGIVTSLADDLLEVKLENGDIHVVDPEVWCNVRYRLNPRTKKIEEEELGSFTQYPVKLAWAITIHKSQGLTFNNVVVDIGRGAFTGGQTYVALSRCRSLEGLTLRSTVNERDIFVHPEIVGFSRTFNDNALFTRAMQEAHADACYMDALRHADKGDLGKAYDKFLEGMSVKPVLHDERIRRLVRRKLSVVDSLRREIAALKAERDSDLKRFADLAAEYVSLGDDCLQDNVPEAAVANFTKALTLLPGHPTALRGRGKALLMLNDAEGAVADFRALVESPQAPVSHVIDAAEAIFTSGDPLDAMNYCLRAEDAVDKSTPKSELRRLYLLMADIFERAGDKGSARDYRRLARQ